MKNKQQLNINFLGEFSIENKNAHFPRDVKKSKQLIILIAYLCIHKKETVSKEMLIDILWPNGSSQNPEGALRNLIYRARKELADFFPEDTIECILSKGNMYIWNNDINAHMDIDDMEELCKKIEIEKDIQQVYKQSMKLLKKYSGKFLIDFKDEQWILRKKDYYEDKIIHTIDIAASKFIEKEAYENVIKLCDYMDFNHLLNSQLHEKKLYSYYKMKKTSQALTYYHKVMDLYYKHFGITVSQGIQDIYRKLIEEESHTPLTVKELVNSLNEKVKEHGTFYCDFDIFKNIYKMISRDAKRKDHVGYIVLLTLSDTSHVKKDVQMEQYSELLKNVISRDLRKNDVFSRCSPLTYAIILGSENELGCEVAMKRIFDNFYKKAKDDTVSLAFGLEKIK